MREWLGEAQATLALVEDSQPEELGAERKKYSSPLVREERKILLGNDGLYQGQPGLPPACPAGGWFAPNSNSGAGSRAVVADKASLAATRRRGAGGIHCRR